MMFLFLISILINFSLTSSVENSCSIFCSGELLRQMQNQNIFGNDSKTFVDSPLLQDPDVVLAAYNKLQRPLTKAVLQNFSNKYFDAVGSDLIPWIPDDWKPIPAIVPRIKNITLRNFTIALNNLWLKLGRQPSPDVYKNPQRHTLLPTVHPVIVPGGRFRENYYWDSYWIVKGLLLSDMNYTAAGIVDNFIDFVGRFGFVPNGGRVYYLTRSQPPLLSEMIKLLFQDKGGNALKKRIPALETEHRWWSNNRLKHTASHSTPSTWIQDKTIPSTCNINQAMSILNHYDADTILPRPESYREDYHQAAAAAAKSHDTNASQVLRNIAAAAESGWDFSSRWFQDHRTLDTIQTTTILPVELNVIMARMEHNICNMSTQFNRTTYCLYSKRRWNIIETCMWNETTSRWNDLIITKRNTISQVININSVSNYIPIWGSYLLSTNSTRVVQAAKSLRDDSGLYLEAGLATTNMHTGQQWDFPNAWSPLQDLIMDGLRNCALVMDFNLKENVEVLKTFAKDLGQRWLKTNLEAFLQTGFMYEKYDATTTGKGGGGGEYVPQLGFGWTNGVMFELLNDL